MHYHYLKNRQIKLKRTREAEVVVYMLKWWFACIHVISIRLLSVLLYKNITLY